MRDLPTLRSLLFFALCAPILCWAQLGLPEVPAERLEQLKAFATTDLEVQRKRWGPWVEMVDQVWVWEAPEKFRNSRGVMNASAFEVRWAIPGAAMHFSAYWCFPGDKCYERTGLAMFNGSEPWGLFGRKQQWFDVAMKTRGSTVWKGAYDQDANVVSVFGADLTFQIKDGKVLQTLREHRVATPDDLPMLARIGIDSPKLKLELAKREEERARASQVASAAPSALRATPQPSAALQGPPSSAATQAALTSDRASTQTSPVARNQLAPPGTERFPEALFVCSRPDASGKFFCDSPAEEDIEGTAGTSPHALVTSAGDVCPSRRRLYSRTHLVWGCGIGATGASRSIDRGQGVDVRGRGIYHCLPQEPDCRRADL